jgi:hypothetical protein
MYGLVGSYIMETRGVKVAVNIIVIITNNVKPGTLMTCISMHTNNNDWISTYLFSYFAKKEINTLERYS